jgi:hydrogenase maturation factor HypF (carbamoyltransferase family)
MKPACVMRDTTNCEGQAAIELEQVADRNCQEDYRFEVSDDGSIILAQKVIRQSVGDLLNGVPPGNVPVEFHPEVANLIGAIAGRNDYGLDFHSFSTRLWFCAGPQTRR